MPVVESQMGPMMFPRSARSPKSIPNRASISRIPPDWKRSFNRFSFLRSGSSPNRAISVWFMRRDATGMAMSSRAAASVKAMPRWPSASANGSTSPAKAQPADCSVSKTSADFPAGRATTKRRPLALAGN